MEIELLKANRADASKILSLFQPIFKPYLEKYHDTAINPANLPLERIESWFDKSFVLPYFITLK